MLNRRTLFGLPLALLGWRRGASAAPAKLAVGLDFGRVPSMAVFDGPSVSYSYLDVLKAYKVHKIEELTGKIAVPRSYYTFLAWRRLARQGKRDVVIASMRRHDPKPPYDMVLHWFGADIANAVHPYGQLGKVLDDQS